MKTPARATALMTAVAIVLAVLLAYAETRAFSFDEGFHLMAARLIKEGKRPYLDFCFPQTPLNAYWNAFWLLLFGDSWRVIHAVSALLIAAAVFLAADLILKRFPATGWQLAAAVAVAFLFGLNGSVVIWGPIGQAYALCLFLTVASFRVCIIAVERASVLLAGAAGGLVSAAAASSLLTAPAIPVLFLWMIYYNRAGNRIHKAAAFIAGAAIPFLPVLWLFIKAPHQVWFNLVDYHLHYRSVHWEDAPQHDFEVLISWIDCSQALLLGLLAVAGLLFIRSAGGWERNRRAEFYLSAWIALLMGVEIATAHPTFSWYFLVIVPFLAIPAAAGIYVVGARLYKPDRPRWPVAVLTVLLALGLAKTIYDDSDSLKWSTMQAMAKKVEQLAPRDGTLWANEHIFFLTHRPIPEGMEFQAGMKLDMPMSQAAPLHILPGPELARRVKSGAYSTIATCDDDKIEKLGLNSLYTNKEDIDSCFVFWGFKGKTQ
jgi:hypothetical protein